MRYETIADIYSANRKIRAGFEETVGNVAGAEAATLPDDDEKWSIQQIVEHVSIVDSSAYRICSKLVTAAEVAGNPSSDFRLSDDLNAKFAAVGDIKLEAPERVQPTGDVTIGDSIGKMRETSRAFNEMRTKLESFDLTGHTFPHPYFGDLTAAEWMIVAGGHELRHTRQIERLLEKIRK